MGNAITALSKPSTSLIPVSPKLFRSAIPDILFITFDLKAIVSPKADRSALFVQLQRIWGKKVKSPSLESTMDELILLAGSLDHIWPSSLAVSPINNSFYIAEIW